MTDTAYQDAYRFMKNFDPGFPLTRLPDWADYAKKQGFVAENFAHHMCLWVNKDAFTNETTKTPYEERQTVEEALRVVANKLKSSQVDSTMRIKELLERIITHAELVWTDVAGKKQEQLDWLKTASLDNNAAIYQQRFEKSVSWYRLATIVGEFFLPEAFEHDAMLGFSLEGEVSTTYL